MGDSISAGFAAQSTSIFELEEYRGLSWSIGGDVGETTAATILQTFSPDLWGFSQGIGERSEDKTDFLNAAVSGSIVQDMPDQADWLIERLKARGNDSWENEWKVITMWVGGNNLCSVCIHPQAYSPDEYEKFLVKTLDKLATIPRTFVNLIPTLDITELDEFESPTCKILHYYECPCVMYNGGREQVKEALAAYNKKIFKVASEYNTTDTFTVVVQPFLIETDIPDRTIFLLPTVSIPLTKLTMQLVRHCGTRC